MNCKEMTEIILIVTAEKNRMPISVTLAGVEGHFDWVACPVTMITLLKSSVNITRSGVYTKYYFMVPPVSY